MKVLLVELAIWVWWTAFVLSVGWVCPLMADQEKDSTTLRFTTITFNTEGTVESYLSFIRELRKELKGSEILNIPVLRNPATVPNNQRFLLVKLQASQQKFVTLVLDVTTMYVLGYGDRYQGRDRARFFPEKDDPAIKLAKSLVFTDAKIRENIPFDFSYGAMEGKAGSRKKINLGIKDLREAIQSVSGEDIKDKNDIEAKFFIIAIQMVSEAARFKYLESKIRQSGRYPDDCMIGLELTWVKISKAIQNVEKLNTDKLDSCPELEGLRGDQLKREIIQQGYMGILKYKEDRLYTISVVSRIVNNRYTIPIGIIVIPVILLVARSKGLKQHKA